MTHDVYTYFAIRVSDILPGDQQVRMNPQEVEPGPIQEAGMIARDRYFHSADEITDEVVESLIKDPRQHVNVYTRPGERSTLVRYSDVNVRYGNYSNPPVVSINETVNVVVWKSDDIIVIDRYIIEEMDLP